MTAVLIYSSEATAQFWRRRVLETRVEALAWPNGEDAVEKLVVAENLSTERRRVHTTIGVSLFIALFAPIISMKLEKF